MNEEIQERAEVVVAGGGLAGVFAAISAARLGCKTALIHDRHVLGGNASSEISVGICGADCSGSSVMRFVRETGLVDEFSLELLSRCSSYAGAVPLFSVILWEMVRREPALSLYLSTSTTEALVDGGVITSVRAFQRSTERRLTIAGRYFIDCTGHGALGAAAGADFRMGREARDEFNESLAPERADAGTMGNSLIFRARDMGRPVPFTAPEWAVKFPTDADLPYRHPHIEKVDQDSDEIWSFWWVEYGGRLNIIRDAEKIQEELLRVLFGIWDHMKNTGDHGVANYELTWLSIPGPRESRRLMGDHILTESEVLSHALFPDRIAYGGWSIDLHPPDGIYAKEPPATGVRLYQPYSLPFRALYSRNISNLLFAGRDISVSHVALGSVRVMATCAIMGQAAGTAAALCCRRQTTPRRLGENHIIELQQQLLRDDCHIPFLPNGDPADLARRAAVSASSEKTLVVERVNAWLELDLPCAQIIPVSAGRIDAIELRLRSTLSHDAAVELRLCRAENINDFESEMEIKTARATVSAKHEGWTRFEFQTVVEPMRFYRVELLAGAGLAWAVQLDPPLGVNRARRDPEAGGRWRAFPPAGAWPDKHRGAFLFRLFPESKPYGAANVLSGIARPEAWTNIWISNAARTLPQQVDLQFAAPVRIDRIELKFDDDLDTNIYLPSPWGRLGKGLPETLVREYRLLVWRENCWEEILRVADNHQRHRVHQFDPLTAEKIRLECVATHGCRQARIYEIRAYGA